MWQNNSNRRDIKKKDTAKMKINEYEIIEVSVLPENWKVGDVPHGLSFFHL